MKRKLIRNHLDPDAVRFWEHVEKTASAVLRWPAWKRGIVEPEPRTMHNSGTCCCRACQWQREGWCQIDHAPSTKWFEECDFLISSSYLATCRPLAKSSVCRQSPSV